MMIPEEHEPCHDPLIGTWSIMGQCPISVNMPWYGYYGIGHIAAKWQRKLKPC